MSANAMKTKKRTLQNKSIGRTRTRTRTRKQKHPRGESSDDDDGWMRITISGAPYERGISHGKQVIAADPERFTYMFSVLDFTFREEYGRDIEFFYGLCDDFYRGIIKRRFPKIFREMEGIELEEGRQNLLMRHADGLEQDGHGHLAAAIDPEVQDVLGVELEVQP